LNPETLKGNMMKSNNEQLVDEIREANLSYIMLAQHIIREDKAAALFRLGVSSETADTIASLSPQQVLKIASSNTLMCQFRYDDDMVWSLLASHANPQHAGSLHAGILMASRQGAV
jgi:flagellar transcriptional activator FlhD